MASPWKFLSRLVSPRREPKQDNDAKPDASATAVPTEELLEQTLDDAARASGIKPPHLHSVDDASRPIFAEEAPSETNDPADSLGADVATVSSSPYADDVNTPVRTARNAARSEAEGKSVAPTRRIRDKQMKSDFVTAPANRDLPAASNDVMSLEEDIRVLRGQLMRKLQMQNAQLKRMLERFER